jgi:isoleucyl-tRNA synthetase
LSSVCIVSQIFPVAEEEGLDGAVEGTAIPGLKILVEAAKGAKCERCWVWSVSVGVDAEHPTVCDRCRRALRALGN